MKKIKFLRLAVFAVGILCALGSTAAKKTFVQNFGYYRVSGTQCSAPTAVDWGWTCDQYAFGPTCTIYGNAAYLNEVGCQYGLLLLYRVI